MHVSTTAILRGDMRGVFAAASDPEHIPLGPQHTAEVILLDAPTLASMRVLAPDEEILVRVQVASSAAGTSLVLGYEVTETGARALIPFLERAHRKLLAAHLDAIRDAVERGARGDVKLVDEVPPLAHRDGAPPPRPGIIAPFEVIEVLPTEVARVKSRARRGPLRATRGLRARRGTG